VSLRPEVDHTALRFAARWDDAASNDNEQTFDDVAPTV
jgi:hypothetical protein